MVRSWNAKFDARGDIAGFEAVGGLDASVDPSQAGGTSSLAQSVATQDTPRDTGFQAPTETLVQEVAALTQAERLSRLVGGL